jgi:hypothetical protein
MSARLVFRLFLPVCVLLALASPACKRRTADFYLPATHNQKIPPASGSLSELKKKMVPKPELAEVIILLVAHDANGRPIAADIRQSSGDAAVDARAQEMVLEKYRFPRGQTNTLVVTIPVRQVPKK